MTRSASRISPSQRRRNSARSPIEAHGSERRARHVAMRAVPWLVAFEKQHLVAAPAQRAHQAAIGRRVAVAPGGGDRQPEDHDPQRARRHTGAVGQRRPCHGAAASPCQHLFDQRDPPRVSVLGQCAGPRRGADPSRLAQGQPREMLGDFGTAFRRPGFRVPARRTSRCLPRHR